MMRCIRSSLLGDKRTKLAVAQMVDFSITRVEGSDPIDFRAGRFVQSLVGWDGERAKGNVLECLIDSISVSGKRDENGVLQETRLSVATTNCSLHILRFAISIALDERHTMINNDEKRRRSLIVDVDEAIDSARRRCSDCLKLAKDYATAMEKYHVERKLYQCVFAEIRKTIDFVRLNLESSYNSGVWKMFALLWESFACGTDLSIKKSLDKAMANANPEVPPSLTKLYCVCSSICQSSPDILVGLMQRDTSLEAKLFDLASSHIFPSPSLTPFLGRDLALALLVELLSASTSTEKIDSERDDVGSRWITLLDDPEISTDDDEGVRQKIAELVGDYVRNSKKTMGLLSEVTERLEKNNTRLNALMVLNHVNVSNPSILKAAEAGSMLERSAVCLTDDSPRVRKEASELFARLDPMLMIPSLVLLVDKGESPTCSAAEAALVTALGRPDCLTLFWDFASGKACRPGFAIQQNAPRSPGQIARLTTHELPPDRVERYARIFSEWAKKMDGWDVSAKIILDKAYSAPFDVTSIRYLSAVAPSWTKPQTVRFVIEGLIEKLERQPRLSLEMLEDQSDESTLAVQRLLFFRIQPLLVLRMFSTESFRCSELDVPSNVRDFWDCKDNGDLEGSNLGEGIGSRLVHELVRRIEHPYEFEQVRKISAEVIGKLPLCKMDSNESLVALLSNKLTRLRAPPNIPVLRSYVYGCCNVVLAHGLDSGVMLEAVGPQLLRIILLCTEYQSANDEGQDNLNRGCLECFSLMLTVSATLETQNSNEDGSKQIGRLTNKSLPDDSPRRNPPASCSLSQISSITANGLCLIRSTALSADAINVFGETATDTFEHRAAISTTFANVITMSLQRLSAPAKLTDVSSGAANVHNLNSVQTREANQWIVRRLVGPCLDLALWASLSLDSGMGHDIFFAACLQALFHMIYNLRGDRIVRENLGGISELCVAGLSSSIALVQKTSLKTLGSIISCATETSGSQNPLVDSIGSTRHTHVRNALKSVITMKTSAEIRDLSQRLLEMVDLSAGL
ncbi:hypothetical protein BJ742DRAFT_791678 [Cladochytrium replicatum]|nr:hypothetical protein BJ742DRAFT_791678 [Cladochytrium replicatum]